MATLISGTKTAEDIVRDHLEKTAQRGSAPPAPAPTSPPLIRPVISPAVSTGDYITLENVTCTDADGRVFEQYAQLQVRKDIFRDAQGTQQNFTPYNAVVHCEQQGIVLPSFALSCNILARLYQHKDNPDCKRVLDQYKDKGNGTGYHAQNTIINFATQQIIHSPSAAEFNQTNTVNPTYPRSVASFTKATLQDSLLEDALRNVESVRYVKQLTGLQDPSILVEIGKYFERPAKLWFPWNGQTGAGNTDTRAAWLGCSNTYFNLNANYYLNNDNAARGVQKI